MSEDVIKEEVLQTWAELRLSLEEIEKDLHKSLEKNNVAAGRRVRKVFRETNDMINKIKKQLVVLEKNRKEGV